MALGIVNISDFKGFRYIATNPRCQSRLQYYIDEYETYYLQKMLGCELYDLFVSDLVDGVPQSPEYLAIYEPFCMDYCPHFFYYKRFDYSNYYYDWDNNRQIISKGMVKCLAGLIYYHYVTDDTFKHSLTGVIMDNNENSKVVDATNLERVGEKRYNDSVESFNAINIKAVRDDLTNFCNYMEIKFLDIV